MSRAPSPRRSLAILTGVVALSAGLFASGTASAAPEHTGLVASAPSNKTPDAKDGFIGAIWDAGSKIIAGGTFTSVENHKSDTPIAQRYVLAFDKVSGAVDNSFAPVVDGEVKAVIAGPTPGTVLIAGAFATVNGVTRKKVAVLNVSDGSVVTSWKGPAINSKVNDVVRAGSSYLLGGAFTVVGGQTRKGLASLNVSDGKLNGYLTTAVDGHHNWTGPGTGAKSPIGPDKLAVSPDGSQLVAIGNFKTADGVLHDQVVKLDLGPSAATIANWNTDQYQPRCAFRAFDSWVRDVAYSPDGSYFVIVTTGAPNAGTLCDASAAWEANATGTNLRPRWVVHSGGDTFLSVTITEHAVYVGGHFRWLNNPLAWNSAMPGAVGRASIAALDPLSGLPLAWNPGRRPRGFGVTELYATPEGLWIGHDTDWIGNYQYRRERIAFFPLAAGYTPHTTNVATLPGKVYQAGNVPPAPNTNNIYSRMYDGTTQSGWTLVSNPDATPWSTARGAFWVGGTLFYGMNGALHRRTFDGTTFGPPSVVNPYSDPYWDTVETDGPTGQTFKGSPSNFYAEINSVTGMFYSGGRLYYTLSGQSGLFWRWFTPDSGTVGAEKFTVAGATGFSDSSGVFVSGSKLYMANKNTGHLMARDWIAGAPVGTFVVVDTQDWRARAVFIAP